MSTLVTFGDSWPAGAELRVGQYPFGHHLASLLELDTFENFAQNATSVEHMVLQLTDYLNEYTDHNNVAVFFITDINRSLYFRENSKNAMEIAPNNGSDAAKHYYKYLHSDRLSYYRFSTSILTLQHLCKKYSIQDYYLVGWSNIEKDKCLIGIDWDKFYANGEQNIVSSLFGDIIRNDGGFVVNEKMRPHFNICHPNASGHRKIATELAKWIKLA